MAGLIPFRVFPWFLAFLAPSILMLGSVMAGLGAACNDAKDAQNLALPGLLPVLIPLFLLMPVLQDPSGPLATGLSLFPLFTPTVMILRLSTTVAVPAWQPWLGLAGVLLTTVLLVWVGGRIFRVGILLQGQPPRLGNLVRWILRG
jgi:ABC-type Na+ efflux pump permease subunit